jgi:DNA polymerase-3 subunit epsilon
MNVLIIDTETTGLDPSKGAKCIEVGALLFNVETKAVIQSLSTLLPCDENPCENINHIAVEWTQAEKPWGAALHFLAFMAEHSKYIIAHNADFDKKFMATLPIRIDRHWICTKNDFRWPVQLYRKRLQDICEAMGVQYTNAHRAINDCGFIAKCFKKVEDLEQRLLDAGTGKGVATFDKNKYNQ